MRGREGCGIRTEDADGKPSRRSLTRLRPRLPKCRVISNTQEFLRKAEEANVIQCAADLLANSPIVLRETAANNGGDY